MWDERRMQMIRQVINRIMFTGTIVLLVTVVFVGSARAAAPRLIMVYGLCLSKPVILDDWAENGQILGVEESNIRPTDLSNRPYFHLALFWGPEWDQYMREGKPLQKLHTDQANQYGRLYPAVGSENPIIVIEPPPLGPSRYFGQV
jgi:hypothetical protein